MSSSQKSFYRKWAEGQDKLPLFYRPDWLDCVCGAEHWEVVLVKDDRGEVLGVLPFYQSKKGFWTKILNPPFSPFMGPYLIYPKEKKDHFSRYGFEKKVLQQLAEQLPKSPFTKLRWRPEIQNWLPFYWAGFQQTTAYTFVIEADQTPGQVYANFKNTVRGDIEFAERHYTVFPSDDPAAFFTLNRAVFEKQDMDLPYTFGQFSKVEAFLKSKKQGRILLAKNRETEKIEAGIFVLTDGDRAYLLATGKVENAGRGALALLIWEAIKESIEEGKMFDFEGSMMPGVEHFFRSFGGRMVPYLVVYRYARVLALLRVMRGKVF